MYYLTRQKNPLYKIKASQLMNYGILLNLKFVKSKIGLFQKQLSEIPSWKTKGSVPINQVFRDALRNKSKLQGRLISSKNLLNFPDAENVQQAYTKARNKVKAIICASKGEFERNIGLQSKNNLRIFWSDVRSELKTKTGMALPPSTQDVN